MIVHNYTQHAVTIRDREGNKITHPSLGLAEAREITEEVGLIHIDGLGEPIVTIRKSVVDVAGLPEPVNGVVYIVAGIVLSALREQGSTRTDVFGPATGFVDGAIRDDKGHIVAVTKLVAL